MLRCARRRPAAPLAAGARRTTTRPRRSPITCSAAWRPTARPTEALEKCSCSIDVIASILPVRGIRRGRDRAAHAPGAGRRREDGAVPRHRGRQGRGRPPASAPRSRPSCAASSRAYSTPCRYRRGHSGREHGSPRSCRRRPANARLACAGRPRGSASGTFLAATPRYGCGRSAPGASGRSRHRSPDRPRRIAAPGRTRGRDRPSSSVLDDAAAWLFVGQVEQIRERVCVRDPKIAGDDTEPRGKSALPTEPLRERRIELPGRATTGSGTTAPAVLPASIERAAIAGDGLERP